MPTLRVLRMILTMRCSEATALASESLDRRLSGGERIALRIHAAICAGCRRYQGQILFLRRALSRLRQGDEALRVPFAESPTLSPQARERLKDALRGEGP